MMDIAYMNGQGLVFVKKDFNGNSYVQSASVQTCPKCGGYMQTIPVDVLSASLINTIGRWRCNKCSYIPSLNTYDKKGVELTERMFDNSLHSKEKETKT